MHAGKRLALITCIRLNCTVLVFQRFIPIQSYYTVKVCSILISYFIYMGLNINESIFLYKKGKK